LLILIKNRKSNGNNIYEWFREVAKPIASGKGGTQYVVDYRLTHYACYLLAMSVDEKGAGDFPHPFIG
jgi:hypothetical protein